MWLHRVQVLALRMRSRRRGLRVGIESKRCFEAEVALEVHHRIVSGGMGVVTLRYQGCGAEVDWTSPKIRQQLAFELDVPHPLRILDRFNRRKRPFHR